jgi:hypothetical protein
VPQLAFQTTFASYVRMHLSHRPGGETGRRTGLKIHSEQGTMKINRFQRAPKALGSNVLSGVALCTGVQVRAANSIGN